MSQAQAPKVPTQKRWTSWQDIDFYKIKLVVDRIDRIGIWYYLFHPRQALRDFYLWLKFKDKIKAPKPLARPELKCGKKKKDRKPDEKAVEVKKKPDDKARVERLRKLAEADDKTFFETVKQIIDEPINMDDKARNKMRKAYDLALDMAKNKMIPHTKEGLDAQVDQMLKFDDSAFEAYERTIKDTIKKKD